MNVICNKKVNKITFICSDTVAGYNCSSRKLMGPNCLSSKDKDTIPVFIEMAQYAMFMFCSSGDGEHGYLREGKYRINSHFFIIRLWSQIYAYFSNY